MEKRHTYPKTLRLSGKLNFAGVYDARMREMRGPVTIYAKPNDLKYARLGLSISRRVGTAPRRNKIKRLLRESFRLMQHDFPRGYDWIIAVRPHVPLQLADYQSILMDLMKRLHAAWIKRESA